MKRPCFFKERTECGEGFRCPGCCGDLTREDDAVKQRKTPKVEYKHHPCGCLTKIEGEGIHKKSSHTFCGNDNCPFDKRGRRRRVNPRRPRPTINYRR